VQGERKLSALLYGMKPQLALPVYVFCTFANGSLPDELEAIAQFKEQEGLTAIVEKSAAELNGLAYTFESRLITLSVHSDLAAVGFLSSVCAALANDGIACNAVSAFFHDHLFVPVDRADDAMRLLSELSAQAASG
jgi:uncharacterized protein